MCRVAAAPMPSGVEHKKAGGDVADSNASPPLRCLRALSTAPYGASHTDRTGRRRSDAFGR